MRYKKTLSVFLILSCLALCSCYDAGDIEETAYLISLGIDKTDEGYSYTFQLASPFKTGGESENIEEKEKEENETEIKDSKNPTVKNIVIAAPDFYTAKNMLLNYLSKNLNMSHLKMIVCSDKVAENSFYEHSELFSREREIRPGTFLSISDGKAEAFLKAVNPTLEGNTAKYYELVNSEENMLYAPVKRLGEFSNDSHTLDKSAVLPIARLSKIKKSNQLSTHTPIAEETVKSGLSRISDSAAEMWGMCILKESKLTGILDGNEALIYNILSGHTKNFTISVQSPFDNKKLLSFNCRTEKTPKFSVQDFEKNILKISLELNLSAEYMGTNLPSSFKNAADLNNTVRKALEKDIKNFLNKTSKVYNADILKIGNTCKKNFLTHTDFNMLKWSEKYKNSEFYINIYLCNNSHSMF